MNHTLRCWPEPFAALVSGDKHHEVRVFDRPYRVGDALILQEWDPSTKQYTGEMIVRVITYITLPGSFGLPENVGVMTVVPER